MIRKFATVPGFRIVLALIFFVTILAGTATVHGQQSQGQQNPAQPAPAQQTPSQPQATPAQPPADNQQSSSQEESPEEVSARRKVKPHDFKNWNFNIGGGGSLESGTTKTFVRQGGGVAAAGVARNYSKYFGFRADFQWDNLPLRTSTLDLAQAPGATSQVYTVMVDPIISVPATRVWTGYVLIGPAYFHRSGKLDSSTAIPGSTCSPFWIWWGDCYHDTLPVNGKFLSASQNEFGLNVGGGVARKISSSLEIYVEYRLLHGSHSSITTDLRPITIGVRW